MVSMMQPQQNHRTDPQQRSIELILSILSIKTFNIFSNFSFYSSSLSQYEPPISSSPHEYAYSSLFKIVGIFFILNNIRSFPIHFKCVPSSVAIAGRRQSEQVGMMHWSATSWIEFVGFSCLIMLLNVWNDSEAYCPIDSFDPNMEDVADVSLDSIDPSIESLDDRTFQLLIDDNQTSRWLWSDSIHSV